MESMIMDLAPSAGQDLKQLMKIEGDYFVDIRPEATDEEADAARLRIIAIGEKILKEPTFDNEAPLRTSTRCSKSLTSDSSGEP